jgi:hypothetical protein
LSKEGFELRPLKKTRGFENMESAKEILTTTGHAIECDDGDYLTSKFFTFMSRRLQLGRHNKPVEKAGHA